MPKFFQGFPGLSANRAIAVLRVTTAVLFLAHAVGRMVLGTIPSFGRFMDAVGFVPGMLWVYAITAAEIICATLLVANRYVRWATIPLLVIAVVGILLIHIHFGWWVGEHGTGGMEYSVALIAMLLAVAAADRDTTA